MFSKSARKRKSEKNAAGKTAQRSAGSEEDVSETSLTWKHLLYCGDTYVAEGGSQVKRQTCSPVTTMDVIKQQLITS